MFATYKNPDRYLIDYDPSLPEPLFQLSPREENTFMLQPHRRCWRDSLETYHNNAKYEYHLLMHNSRQANHLVTVKYMKQFFISKIRELWLSLKKFLRQHGIIAYTVVEGTTNGSFGKPVNRIHYHFLVDSGKSELELRQLFKDACVDIGLIPGDEFQVHYAAIPNRKEFNRLAKYVLKYDQYAKDALLFKFYVKINKIDTIGNWYIYADGTKWGRKDDEWKKLIDSWYPNRSKPPVTDPREQTSESPTGTPTLTTEQHVEFVTQIDIPLPTLSEKGKSASLRLDIRFLMPSSVSEVKIRLEYRSPTEINVGVFFDGGGGWYIKSCCTPSVFTPLPPPKIHVGNPSPP